MKTLQSFVAVCAMLAAGHALGINKCTGPDGKAVFQDRPCAGAGEKINVRPASGHAPAPIAVASGVRPMSEADRLNALTEASQKDRRRWELREHLLPAARSEIAQHQQRCAQMQRDLAADQYRYVQNLYGKTHAAQMASEMSAAASLCDTKNRELKEKAEMLATECKAVDCMRQ